MGKLKLIRDINAAKACQMRIGKNNADVLLCRMYEVVRILERALYWAIYLIS